MNFDRNIAVTLAAVLLLACGCANVPQREAIPAHAVIGVNDSHLNPSFWIQRDSQAERVVLSPRAIAAQNARLQRIDPSLYDIERLPPNLPAEQVREWIAKLSTRPERALFDERGAEVPASAFDALMSALNLDAIPATQAMRYGMVVQRADLRTFPSTLRVFGARGDTDIDRFQESALFPGTPVALVHESRDGEWWFAVSTLYAAWIEKRHVALGASDAVFAYTRKSPFLVVTGATARTVFTREAPAVSELQLEMGTRVPLLDAWPAHELVNGQHPYTAHIIELPVRAVDGSLHFSPALLPKTSDVASDYLPLSRANLLRQGFKFLGERYGWGHSYNARDCSGFVSEVYRSFGVQLPRNTSDQGVTPAIDRIALTPEDDHDKRLAILKTLQVGDLIYIPRHVMMVIGHDDGVPYVIHDTTGITYRDPGGELKRVPLNSVAVTPLTPLLLGEGEPMVDRIYSILRIR